MNRRVITQWWYKKHWMRWCLYPLAGLFQWISWIRRYSLERWYQTTFSVPIVVVGNITVGGVGKTPLVIAIAKQAIQRGLCVGIVSRGYGASISLFPHEISSDDSAALVGDEPLLMAQKTRCPVVIAPKRVEAVQYLLNKYSPDLIISDDGLQHYALGRAVELVVVDGLRGFGNGLCLPAGPLREPVSRLNQTDFVVVNGANWPQAERMDLLPGAFQSLVTGQTLMIEQQNTPVAAVAGIGNPQRFFSTLQNLGIAYTPYPFDDHHPYCANDLIFPEKIMVMTEKDGVKCKPYAQDTMFVLPVEAELSATFWKKFWAHPALHGLGLTH